ncbi:MAG: PQQ-binding-like beta-propeller repeat protein [Gammaproteobacteria bacterium]|nr:PQQ-binding-like beta-propeller repeat protein [Gammaproteobacteria bacterium]
MPRISNSRVPQLRSSATPASGAVAAAAVTAGCVIAAALLAAAPAAAQKGGDAGATVEWPTYRGSLAAQNYSPLEQIDAGNVGELRIEWRWHGANFGPRPESRNQSTPLMVDGVLYFPVGVTRNVVAVDARTGQTLWLWRAREGERYEQAPRRMSGRGVAYWTDGEDDARILTVTPGFHLVALDAQTGLPVPEFGEDGVVDMMRFLRGPADNVEIGSTSPPLVVGDVVIVGPAHGVGARPDSKTRTKGDVRAFDVRTGELRWTFHTIPERGELGYDTWLDGSAEYTGNAGVWAPMAADPELGYVYLPVEGATSDMYGGERPGDNLFATSLVALDARTGERIWHRQLIHHDIWDWDNPTAPILLDVTVDGRPVKAVVQLTKQAFAYAFDRQTGEPLWPLEERPVPQSDVPYERTAATQPFPTKPPAYDRQGFSEDDLIDFTPEIKAAALEQVRDLRMGPMFSPPSLVDADDGTRGTLVLPHFGGGANWEGGAADPETGILYVGSITNPAVFALRPSDPGFTDIRYVFVNGEVPQPMDLPLVKPPWGRITAIDMNRGEHVWMVPNGDTPEDVLSNPALEGVEIPRTGKRSRAALLVTKTLLFAGEGYGGDPILRAHDKRTGEIVAEIELPGAVGGLPMSYMLDGRQFIAVMVGREGPAQLITLALP